MTVRKILKDWPEGADKMIAELHDEVSRLGKLAAAQSHALGLAAAALGDDPASQEKVAAFLTAYERLKR